MESQESPGPSGPSAGQHAAETAAGSEALQKPLVVRIFDASEQPGAPEEARFPEEAYEQGRRGESEEPAESDELPSHPKPRERYQPYASRTPLKPQAPYGPRAPREPRKPPGPPVPRAPHKPREMELLPRAGVTVSPSLLLRPPPQLPPSSLSGRCGGLSGALSNPTPSRPGGANGKVSLQGPILI